MAGHGTKHHKRRNLMGAAMIFALIPVLIMAMGALPNGFAGLTDWLSHRPSALIFLAFFTVAIWYCKLEFDEVILDYFEGGLRSFSLLTNKIVAFLAWAAALFAVIHLAFLG